MSMQSPLGRVKGLGSAHEGVGHWRAQRISAIALLPLSLWFVISVIGLVGADYAALEAFLGTHGNLLMMVLFLGTMFWHLSLGLQVVIEDYVHGEAAKTITLLVVKFACALLGLSTVLAALHVAYGG